MPNIHTHGEEVERGDNIKFQITSDLSLSTHITYRLKMAQKRLFFIRTLKTLPSASDKLLRSNNRKPPLSECNGEVWKLHRTRQG